MVTVKSLHNVPIRSIWFWMFTDYKDIKHESYKTIHITYIIITIQTAFLYSVKTFVLSHNFAESESELLYN
jgi:hypothetical protein